MKDITGFLEGFEKLAYQLLIWFIMIPKTLLKIIIDPGWVPGYVRKELDDKEIARFDDYFSPVILFLFVSLVPYVVLQTFRIPGINIEGPTQGNVGSTYEFKSTADFIWDNPEEYTLTWSIWDASRANSLPSESPNFTYPWSDDKTQDVFRVNFQLIPDQASTWTYDFSQNVYTIALPTTGLFWIQLSMSNNVGEGYIYQHPMYLVEAGILVDSTSQNFDTESTKTGARAGDVGKALQGENSLIAAFVFLSLPLAFTLLTGGLRQGGISGTGLKQAFYMQCYYFSPLFLAYYIDELTYWYFYIPAYPPHRNLSDFTSLIILAMLIWFVVAEILFVMKERKARPLLAVLWITGIVVAFGLVQEPISNLIRNQDILRNMIWSIYPILFLVTVLLAGWRWGQNRKARGVQPNQPDPAPGAPLHPPEETQALKEN